jgi:hypothetical protein
VGRRLSLNKRTGEGGSVRVELQSADGRVLSNFAERDCAPLTGDQLDTSASWRAGSDVSVLSGDRLRLRFVVKDADVYSFRFAD